MGQTTIDPGMSKEMLNFQQEVLRKVSFDQGLFEKELKKSEQWLLIDDLKLLVDWVLDTFTSTFKDLKESIKRLFSHLSLLPA